MLLDVLWQEAKLTKKHVAGTLIAVNLIMSGIAGSVAPVISSALYQATDVSWFSTYMLIVTGTCLPLAIVLISGRLTPGFGTPPSSGASTPAPAPSSPAQSKRED
jgi:hypothetical protein